MPLLRADFPPGNSFVRKDRTLYGSRERNLKMIHRAKAFPLTVRLIFCSRWPRKDLERIWMHGQRSVGTRCWGGGGSEVGRGWERLEAIVPFPQVQSCNGELVMNLDRNIWNSSHRSSRVARPCPPNPAANKEHCPAQDLWTGAAVPPILARGTPAGAAPPASESSATFWPAAASRAPDSPGRGAPSAPRGPGAADRGVGPLQGEAEAPRTPLPARRTAAGARELEATPAELLRGADGGARAARPQESRRLQGGERRRGEVEARSQLQALEGEPLVCPGVASSRLSPSPGWLAFSHSSVTAASLSLFFSSFFFFVSLLESDYFDNPSRRAALNGRRATR
jgi:hypothetical protein